MKKLIYRTQQFFFSIAMNSIKKTPKITEKCNALLDIPEIILNDGYKKAFIVTTNGFIQRKTLLPLFSSLDNSDINYSVFTDVVPDPTFECVEKGTKAYTENGGGIIIAIGGGSVMDCAKMIGARYAKPSKPLSKMKGLLKILKKCPPLYAVPTTSGTGSEVTVAAVLTDENHVKYAFEDFSIMPTRAILDPSLTLGLSPYLTAITGMDALTHALESYTNKFSSQYVKKVAGESIILILENLDKACKNGEDIDFRTKMMRASMLGGLAINRGFVGYVHALAHAVGGMYGIPHGEACAVLLPHVLKSYGKSAEKKLSRLAVINKMNGNSRHELSEKFIKRLESLCKEIGLPNYFEALKENDFDTLISRADKEAHPLYPVPKITDKNGLKSLLEKVYKNREIS